MEGQTRERWKQLCEQAATEQDPDRLLTLITEINRLLQEKEDRLKRQQVHAKPAASDETAA